MISLLIMMLVWDIYLRMIDNPQVRTFLKDLLLRLLAILAEVAFRVALGR